MKLLKTLALSTALALAPLAAANATTFDFSYTFAGGDGTSTGSPVTVSGSFTGTLEGTTFIDNIGNLSVLLNGSAFTGPLGVYNTDAAGNLAAGNAEFFLNAADNHFAIYDSGDINSASNVFSIFGNTAQVAALFANGNFVAGNEAVTSWTVAAVPEPSTYALLLAGLGLMTMVARRRASR